jgi:pimeloyl-ACP methyl ester carboxylesterase
VPDPAQTWADLSYTSRDGLRLYARHYPAPSSRRRPVICLAGLTRNSRDFHDLATYLSDSSGQPRDVYCLDYRGRGRSEFAADASTYTIMTELGDVLDFMALAGLSNVGLVGTSRGGLIALAMAAMRPNAFGPLVLNDIGPVIERDGLVRIVAYVGRVPLPGTWTEATALVKSLNSRVFPNETDVTWAAIARQVFNEIDGRPAPGYDPGLSKSLTLSDGPIPQLWPQFAALARKPVLCLRGANSDILSESTVVEMRRRHPDIETLTIPHQGHAPLLRDQLSVGAIHQFLLRHDPASADAPAMRTERRLLA